jgi:hypothetical protein
LRGPPLGGCWSGWSGRRHPRTTRCYDSERRMRHREQFSSRKHRAPAGGSSGGLGPLLAASASVSHARRRAGRSPPGPPSFPAMPRSACEAADSGPCPPLTGGGSLSEADDGPAELNRGAGPTHLLPLQLLPLLPGAATYLRNPLRSTRRRRRKRHRPDGPTVCLGFGRRWRV